MATVTEAFVTGGFEEAPYPITSEVFCQMIEDGLIPRERRVFLWGGRLFEKVAKTKPHAAVQGAFNQALSRRLPPGLFLGSEYPIRLDETHLPAPDLIAARGEPLDFFDTRYPDGRDVRLVVEVAVSSLREDLGPRISRYAQSLPHAVSVVADIPHRQILVHSQPRVEDERGGGRYGECAVVRPGEAIRLRLEGVELEPIPYEEVMR